jgi:hypothetical protein
MQGWAGVPLDMQGRGLDAGSSSYMEDMSISPQRQGKSVNVGAASTHVMLTGLIESM